MIIYQEGSLFDAPQGSMLLHACNAQGVWGSGIAVAFRRQFPEAFRQYREYCVLNREKYISGTTILTDWEKGYKVGCLITSASYGKNVDFQTSILKNTRSAIDYFFDYCLPDGPIHSNKFNSGLFGVPWEETEAIVNEFCTKYNIDWTVWTPSERVNFDWKGDVEDDNRRK